MNSEENLVVLQRNYQSSEYTLKQEPIQSTQNDYQDWIRTEFNNKINDIISDIKKALSNRSV